MLDKTLAFTPAWELSKLIQAKKLSPVELINLFLSRIRELNPKLSAYLFVDEEKACAEAKKAEQVLMRQKKCPPLLGIPVSVKDLIFVKDGPTTGGSLAYKDFVPKQDAPVVERLRKAGAIIIGKTNTSEFGLSATTENHLSDHCRNPWNLQRTAGGSSGGAASAVAAGLGPLALGSDTGGSIRIPSGFCGVYGLKPTQGRVPYSGCFGGMSMFTQIGPIARTVRDAAFLLQAIAGPDAQTLQWFPEVVPDFLEELEKPSRSLRIAWTPDLGYASVDAEVRQIATRAALSFGDLGYPVDVVSLELEDPFSIFSIILLTEEYATHGHLLKEHGDDLMPYVRSILEAGSKMMGHEYCRALQDLERFRVQIAKLFVHFDLLITPTNAVTAFPVGQRPTMIDGKLVNKLWGAFPFTTPFNLTGQPAANLPCGFSSNGLPIGLQVIGRPGKEAAVLQASVAFEAAHPWANKYPPGTYV